MCDQRFVMLHPPYKNRHLFTHWSRMDNFYDGWGWMRFSGLQKTPLCDQWSDYNSY